MSPGYYYRGEKPVYGQDSNVFYASHICGRGVEMTGPVCDPKHKIVKLLAKWVELDEFEKEWRKVDDPGRDQAVA